MNLGQAFGEMQLRISNLEEGGAVDQPSNGRTEALEIRRLRAELDASRTSETKALLEVARCKGELAARETIISDMRLRLAQQSAEKAVDPKGYEAKLRGKDQQLAELQRQLEQRQRPAEVVEQPAAVDCPVCKAIKLMVLGVEPKPAPIAAELITAAREPVATPKRPYGNHVTEGALRGIAAGIRSVLAAAEAPLTAHEIGRRAGIPAEKVQTNIPHLRNTKHDKIIRLGKPGGYGWNDDGYRYWLASRPLPDGFQA